METAFRGRRRPAPERVAYLPLLPSWIGDASQPPAVLVGHRRCHRRAGQGGGDAVRSSTTSRVRLVAPPSTEAPRDADPFEHLKGPGMHHSGARGMRRCHLPIDHRDVMTMPDQRGSNRQPHRTCTHHQHLGPTRKLTHQISLTDSSCMATVLMSAPRCGGRESHPPSQPAARRGRRETCRWGAGFLVDLGDGSVTVPLRELGGPARTLGPPLRFARCDIGAIDAPALSPWPRSGSDVRDEPG